jgi:hypothetical protein
MRPFFYGANPRGDRHLVRQMQRVLALPDTTHKRGPIVTNANAWTIASFPRKNRSARTIAGI